MHKNDYGKMERKLFFRFTIYILLIALALFLFYRFAWQGKGGDAVVSFLENSYWMDHESAFNLYHLTLRTNFQWIAGIVLIAAFLVLYRRSLKWFSRYLHEIDHGLDGLTTKQDEIVGLSPEIMPIEQRMVTLRQTIEQREMEARLAEQRKNDMVTYLAHDIRTPLTSVIGYLSLLDEAPDMTLEQKAKYIHITLDKAKRLEKLVNEFFEITRYNLQQIVLRKEQVDLYYLLVQMKEELYPLVVEKNVTIAVHADESLVVYADRARLARVLNNVMKNAASYCAPETQIEVNARQREDLAIEIAVRNQGPTIPAAELKDIFDKFYRLDESRGTETGGSGLGLAIAKEIVTLHGGEISATSQDHITEFAIVIPLDTSGILHP